MHPGHIQALKAFKKLGDILIIAVSSDARVKKRKGAERPLQTAADRAHVLDAIRYVDFVFVAPEKHGGDTSPTFDILDALRPDVFASSDEAWREHERDIAARGSTLHIMRRQSDHSTSDVIHKAKQTA